MADVSIDKLVVSVEARTAQMERQLKKLTGQTGRTANTIEKQFGGLKKSFADAGNSFRQNFLASVSPAALIGGLGIGALTQGINQAINDVADIGELATRIGLGTDALQALQKQALATGVTSEQLVKGLQAIGEQAATSGSFLDKLSQANGKSLRDANGNLRPMIEIIKQYADLIRNAATEQEKLAIATGVMGDRIGRELVEMFNQGAAGVDQAFKDMIKSGNYHTEAQIREMEKIRDQYNIIMGEIATAWQKTVIGMVTGTKTAAAAIGGILNDAKAAAEYIAKVASGQSPGPAPIKLNPDGTYSIDESQIPQETAPRRTWMQSPEFGGRNVVRENVPATVLPQPPTPQPPKPPKPTKDNSAEEAERARLEREINFFEEQKRRQEAAVNEFREANEKAAAAEKKANEDAARASAEAWEKFSSGMESIAQGVYSDLMNGASAAETLQNALRRLADTAFNELMGLLFHSPTGGGMSPFASLLQSAFGGGAAAAGSPAPLQDWIGSSGAAPGPIGAPAGNAGMSVRVYPPAGQPVATKQRSGGDGRALDIYIGDQVRKVAPSVVGKMMPSQYGVTPALTRRT